MRAMITRGLQAGALIAACLALNGCEFDRSVVPFGTPRPVVHMVLDPTASTQVLFLERTLTGTVDPGGGGGFNRNDPVVTSGGDPISGAYVLIRNAAGDSVVAPEDADTRDDGRGAGVYRFDNSNAPGGLPVEAGGQYFLYLVTPEGEILTGETRVPGAQNIPPATLSRNFNRDSDTLNLFWDSAAGAHRYEVRVDAPYGPLLLFTDKLEASLPGDMRNFLEPGLRRLFFPGFRTGVSVTAIDRNYFDYMRSGSDPFTGRGIISSVTGGLGVFGAVVPLYSSTLFVEANETEPIEGPYRLAGAQTGRLAPTSLHLWVESQADERAGLSGWHESQAGSGSFVGLYEGDAVTLNFLVPGSNVGDTLSVFTGTFIRDSLIGSVRRGPIIDPARYGRPSMPGVLP
jgi:hypothetical protein